MGMHGSNQAEDAGGRIREKIYYRNAFMEGGHLMGITCAAAAAMAFPGLWILALPVADLLYLAARVSGPAFRRRIELSQASEMTSQLASARQKMISLLDEKSIADYRRFVEELRAIESVTRSDNQIMTDSMDLAFLDSDLAQLSHLAWIYLKTLHTRQRLMELICREEPILLVTEKEGPPAEDSTTRRRIENLRRAREELKSMDQELESLRGRVSLMKSNQLLVGNPELFWHDVDEAGKGVDITGQWLDQAEVAVGAPIRDDAAQAGAKGQGAQAGRSPFSNIRTRIEHERK